MSKLDKSKMNYSDFVTKTAQEKLNIQLALRNARFRNDTQSDYYSSQSKAPYVNGLLKQQGDKTRVQPKDKVYKDRLEMYLDLSNKNKILNQAMFQDQQNRTYLNALQTSSGSNLDNILFQIAEESPANSTMNSLKLIEKFKMLNLEPSEAEDIVDALTDQEIFTVYNFWDEFVQQILSKVQKPTVSIVIGYIRKFVSKKIVEATPSLSPDDDAEAGNEGEFSRVNPMRSQYSDIKNMYLEQLDYVKLTSIESGISKDDLENGLKNDLIAYNFTSEDYDELRKLDKNFSKTAYSYGRLKSENLKRLLAYAYATKEDVGDDDRMIDEEEELPQLPLVRTVTAEDDTVVDNTLAADDNQDNSPLPIDGYGLKKYKKYGIRRVVGRGLNLKHDVDLKKLDKNVLCVRYKNNSNGYKVKPISISENTKKLIIGLAMSETFNEQIFDELLPKEKRIVEYYVYKMKIPVQLSKENLNDLSERFEVLKGELRSGNNNPKLKQMLIDLTNELYYFGYINKQLYTSIKNKYG